MSNKNIDAVDPHRPVEHGLPMFDQDATREEQTKGIARCVESFKPHKLARRTDPDTSRFAAKAAGSLVINHQRLIINALSEESAKDNMGLTSDEIAIATGLTLVQTARRTSDLESSGIIYKTGLTRKTRTGRIATVWRLVGH